MEDHHGTEQEQQLHPSGNDSSNCHALHSTRTTPPTPTLCHATETPPASPTLDSTTNSSSSTTGLGGSTSNMLNSILGAGILGMPYALRVSGGLLPGVCLFALISWFTTQSLRVLIDCLDRVHRCQTQQQQQKVEQIQKKKHKKEEMCRRKLQPHRLEQYQDIMHVLYGRTGEVLVYTFQLLGGYGTLLAYLLIIKDTVPPLLSQLNMVSSDDMEEESSEEQQRWMLFWTAMVCVLPPCLCQNLAALSHVSGLSVLADGVLVLLMCIYAPIQQSLEQLHQLNLQQPQHTHAHPSEWWWWDILIHPHHPPTLKGLFIAGGIITYAMSCQGSSFVLYQSLYNRTPHRWSIVTYSALSFSSLLSIVMGAVGYMGFMLTQEQDELYGSPKGDVLLYMEAYHGDGSGEEGKVAMVPLVARSLLLVTMFLTYPVCLVVMREIALALWEDYTNTKKKKQQKKGPGLSEGGPQGIPLAQDQDHEQPEQDASPPSSSSTPSFQSSNTNFCNFFSPATMLTLLFFFSSLFPALYIHHVGHILSLTGAAGSTFIGFVAPGMMLLRVYGDEFRVWAENGRWCWCLSGFGKWRRGGYAHPMEDEDTDADADAEGQVELPTTTAHHQHDKKKTNLEEAQVQAALPIEGRANCTMTIQQPSSSCCRRQARTDTKMVRLWEWLTCTDWTKALFVSVDEDDLGFGVIEKWRRNGEELEEEEEEEGGVKLFGHEGAAFVIDSDEENENDENHASSLANGDGEKNHPNTPFDSQASTDESKPASSTDASTTATSHSSSLHDTNVVATTSTSINLETLTPPLPASTHKRGTSDVCLAVAFITYGIVLGVVGFVSNVSAMIKAKKE